MTPREHNGTVSQLTLTPTIHKEYTMDHMITTPWFDGTYSIGKRLEGVEWYDRDSDTYIKCSMPCLELCGITRIVSPIDG